MRMEASNKIGIPISKKKVYVVTSQNLNCEYLSHFCIEKIFTNEEKAMEYMKQCARKEINYLICYDVVEYEVETDES